LEAPPRLCGVFKPNGYFSKEKRKEQEEKRGGT